MGPKTPTVSGQFTQRDLEIVAAAWDCFDSQPTINWNKLAEVAGFKHASSARACFLPIKKKLLANASATGASTAMTPSTSKSQRSGGPGRNKRAASPANGVSKGRAKKSKIANDDINDDDEPNAKDENYEVDIEAQIATDKDKLKANIKVSEYLDEGI